MKKYAVLTVCLVMVFAFSIAMAQQTCDFVAVGQAMESSAAEGDWSSAYAYAEQIVNAHPEDISTLSGEEQYYIGLAHMYKMAQAFKTAQNGLEGDRADLASRMSQMVLSPTVEDVRTISHGEEVELTDYLVPGQKVIFDFTSEYCPPCRMIGPLVEQVAQERDDVVLVKVDINRPDVQGIDWVSPVARQYDLGGIPHFKIYGPEGDLIADDAEGRGARQMVNQWISELEG